ncbi:MAG: translation initiation factor IF-2 [Bacteroidetes bacterium]|nr:translation initiation factor IF-2 [Bacteroidota bacterium]
MSETSTIRLSKVLKEFSIGIDHILDFLEKKGINVEKSPNAKIAIDAYELLQREFQTDKQIKKTAEEITNQKFKKDNVIIEAKASSLVVKELEVEPEDNLTRDLAQIKQDAAEKEKPSTAAKKSQPAEEKLEESKVIKAKIEKTQPKVVDKIDLDALDTPKKKSAKKKAADEIAEAAEIKAATEIKEAEKKKDSDKKKTKEKEKPVESEIPKEKEAVKEKPSVKSKEKGKEKETVAENPTELPAAEVKTEEVAKEVIASEETPVLDTEVVAPPGDLKDVPFRMDRDKLTGPTILGKIVLPVDPPKKKPVASSSTIDDDKRKKKRKRTEKKINVADSNTVPRPHTEIRTEPWKRPGSPPGGGGGAGAAKGKKYTPPPKVEPTEKEIQDQIKATLARLSGAGKSKSSKHRKEKREAYHKAEEVAAEEANQAKMIKVTEFVSANELAKLIGVPVTEIIATCMSLGIIVSINQRLDAETLTVVADEFGFKVEFVSVDVQEAIQEKADEPEDLKPRSPIVTVMGHVDHGKTSLLDYIRKANVISGEAGGITQHIGADEVKLDDGRKITFLDTPGHEAFTAMRARGAKVTDVAIIVIAADDSVMPQTIEAINHAQAANVPIVFAINKIDKPGASPDRIKEQLSKMNILVEEWGGKYQCQEISAKQGLNISNLLEKVLLEAEILDLKANPNKNAVGTVIESSLDKGRGYVTTVLVQNGSLQVGDIVLAGCYAGRVKALFNERGNRMNEAGPAQPVIMLGMAGAVQAGDQFNVMDDERDAREIANKRLQLQREQGIRTHKHITLDEIGRRLAIGNFKELNVIVKGDVDGSVEALADSLLKLSTLEIQVNVIHKSVGAITESDVLLASASNAIIIGFQVRPAINARRLAEQEQIDIRLYSIIYDAINEVKDAMEGMLAPEFQEKIICNLEVREVFKIPKAGTIAGCMVLDGKITRNTKVRIIRDGIVAHSGELSSLKRFKDDVKEVATGYECGLSLNNFNDIQIGDIVEGYEQVAVKRTLA